MKEGRRQKAEGRRQKEEGRRKKEEGRSFVVYLCENRYNKRLIIDIFNHKKLNQLSIDKLLIISPYSVRTLDATSPYSLFSGEV
ncbi:MAG: hypothetical protein F6K39_21310 [Okeania sp. SIO3B3]|nr:hypothetical protein [Okeania sp. SIO3B3]